MNGPALGVVRERGETPKQAVRAMCAVVVLTAVASSALLLWLAAGDGDEAFPGIEASCVYRFEDGGGDTSICGRVVAGARANVMGQLALAALCGVVALRRRKPLVWLRAAVAVSIAVTVLCYVFMRSWEFGQGQRLL